MIEKDDPRVDPAPGDVVTKGRSTRTVIRTEHPSGYAATVTFMESGKDHEKRITVRSWRRWAAAGQVARFAAERPQFTVIGVGGHESRYQDLTFADIQRLVGGTVEVLRLPNGVLCVNEDGGPLGLSPNAVASKLVGQTIVGDVVVVPGKFMKRVLDL